MRVMSLRFASIDSAAVERVSSTNYLGVHIGEDLSWTANTASLAKKAQQRLYFLRKPKRASASPPIMTTVYRGTIDCAIQIKGKDVNGHETMPVCCNDVSFQGCSCP
ncbi:hypothetical protein ACEWY4_024593 [Coilia grayii]|uniref:Alkylated DNA repair protein AlkB homologue 8 N-terminal domain-containing protein n=1 Tax=Coilia grayii TaxID=363190 RepID=A0ABD1IW54_9TELE